MDHQLEVNNALLEAINGSVSLFNDLFTAIAPIDCTSFTTPAKESSTVSGVADTTSHAVHQLHNALRSPAPATNLKDSSSINHVFVDLSSTIQPIQNSHSHRFTGSQCLQIQHLSGHLSNIRNSVRRLHILHNRIKRGNRNDDKAVSDNVFLQTKLTESNNLNALMSMQMSAIKNYLVNEINRSEEADKLLHEKENALVEMTVQRDDFRKKSIEQNLKSIAGLGCADKNHLNSDQHDVSGVRKNLVGVYIRKEFDKEFYFGLVVLFRAPFYKVLPPYPLLPFPSEYIYCYVI